MKNLPIFEESRAEFHTFKSSFGSHIFVVDGSRIYDIISPSKTICNEKKLNSKDLPNNQADGDIDLHDILSSTNNTRRYIDRSAFAPPPLYSLSLNVAQTCNMKCGYCYADEGLFGGTARMMETHVAISSVNRLFADSNSNTDLVLGFMGGEPLLNRNIVHTATRYAARAAQKTNRKIRFSITTNGSLIKKEDAELFSEFPFTVSISVDGMKETHDEMRKMKDGTSSYERLLSGLNTFSRYGRPQHLTARVTVTPKTGELLPILDDLIGLGFDEVGFAAVIISPIRSLAFSEADFPLFLKRMIMCGQRAMQEIEAGRIYPFGNFETALREIHKGTHRPYPCGAGAAYLSVNSEGKLFACHRLIDDPQFAMGSVFEGSDLQKRSTHLKNSHVDNMQPCKSCWARYLCGGGCYHEVSRRGRIGCDYIRGWLDFCLKAYVDLSIKRPEYFEKMAQSLMRNISSPITVEE